MLMEAPDVPQPGLWSSIREALRGRTRTTPPKPQSRHSSAGHSDGPGDGARIAFRSRRRSLVGRLGPTLSPPSVSPSLCWRSSFPLASACHVDYRDGRTPHRREDPVDAAIAGMQAIFLGLIVSLAIGVPSFVFAPQLLRLMGRRPKSSFPRPITPAHCCGRHRNARPQQRHIPRSRQRSHAMRLLRVSNIINLILDPCLIFDLRTFPV